MNPRELKDEEIFRRLKENPIALYDEADAKLAEKISFGPLEWLVIIAKTSHPKLNQNLKQLFLRKAIDGQPPDIQFQVLMKLDETNFNNFYFEFFSDLFKSKEFQQYLCTHPYCYLFKDLIADYSVFFPEDKEITTEIQKKFNENQLSETGIKERQIFFHKKVLEIINFPESTDPSFKHDFAAIHVFLMDEDRVKIRLKELEELLEREAKAQDKLEPMDEKKGHTLRLKGYEKGKPFKDNKFFSTILCKLATKFGFGPRKKVEAVLKEEEFFRMFKDKRLIKDKAFGGSFHGEWTHFIQWLCIALEYQANHHFLRNPPADVYQWFGTLPGKYWDMTFEDQVPHELRMKRSKGFDARKVIDFDNFLRGEFDEYLTVKVVDQFPLLQQSLQGRANKRDHQNALRKRT